MMKIDKDAHDGVTIVQAGADFAVVTAPSREAVDAVFAETISFEAGYAVHAIYNGVLQDGDTVNDLNTLMEQAARQPVVIGGQVYPPAPKGCAYYTVGPKP